MDETLIHKSLHMASDVVRKLKKEDMTKLTPCSEWDVRELTNHLLNEVAWIEPLLKGKTIAEVGGELDGDLIGDDAWASWQKYCKGASRTVMETAPDAIAHLSYANKSAEAYVKEVAADIIVHGWDLAQALGQKYEVDDETAASVIEATKEMMPMSRKSGIIGKRGVVSNNASAMDKLLAEYGRSNKWRK